MLSHEACLRKLRELMRLRPALRAEQAALRKHGIYRGIGFATVIELTNPSAAFYGVGGARIASQDGATVRLEPTGDGDGDGRRGRAGPGRPRASTARSRRMRWASTSPRCASSPATPTSRPTAAAPGPRAAPASAARRCCRPALALRANILKLAAGRSSSASATTLAVRRDCDRRPRTRANSLLPLAGTRPHRLLPLRHPARRLHARADGDAALCAARLPVHLHQRRAGLLRRGRRRNRLRHDCSSTGRWRTAAACSTRCWWTSRCAARSCRASAARCYEECLYDERGLMLNGSMADYLVPMAARDAGHRGGARADARPRVRSSAPRAPAKRAPPARRRP